MNYFHAIIFEVDAPLEVEIIRSSVVVVRSMSSERFRVNLIAGGTYKELLLEINKLSGLKQNVPPYWAQGIHIWDNFKYSLYSSLNNNLKFSSFLNSFENN